MTRASLALILAALFGACGESGQTVADAKIYAKDGLRFEYPVEWRVASDEVDSSKKRTVYVDGPGQAMFVIHVVPTDLPRAALRAYAEVTSYSTGETSRRKGPTRRRPSTLRETTEGGEQIVTERETVTILGDTLPQTVVHRMRIIGGHTCFLTSQVVDEHAARAAPGFDRITRSLRFTP